MGKLLKILLTVIASLVLLNVIAIVVLPFIIDPNDFKPQIQTVVKDNLGRELTIEGDLQLSVFPWIGVSTGKLSLSNAEGFNNKPFAEIQESDIKVKLVPLFSKQIEVSRIVLKGLALNLAKNKQGVGNWEDLASTKEEKAEPAEEKVKDSGASDSTKALAALAIGGISIEAANIVWDDQQAGKYLEIKDFNLLTDELAFDEPMGIDLSLSLINKEPQLTEKIALKTDLIINQSLNAINLKTLRLDSESQGKSIPGGELRATLKADVGIDLAQQTMAIDGLKLNTGDLNVSADIKGSHIKDQPVLTGPVSIAEFNLVKFLKQLSVDIPEMQDGNAMSKVAVNFNLQATDHSASLRDLTIGLDDSTLKGRLDIKDFSGPALVFNLNVDAIDADRYLPAEKKESKAKSSPATPAAVAASGATLLPVETLRGLNADGDLTIGSLKISNLKMQGVKLKLNAANGQIKTRQEINQFYQGAYFGNTAINVKGRQPTISLNEKLSNVKIEPLLQDLQGDDARITGTVNANAKLHGYGNTAQAIKSSLDGDLDFLFKDGVIRGFNLQKMIDNTKALIEGTPLPTENKNDQTVFSEISGSAKITNGLVRNNDLQAISSKVHVNGEGPANLATEQLDYKVNGKLIKRAAAEDQPEKIEGVPLIIKIGGTFAKPSYTLDIPAMLMEKNKAKIEEKKEKVLKKLDEKLGPGVGDLLKGIFR